MAMAKQKNATKMTENEKSDMQVKLAQLVATPDQFRSWLQSFDPHEIITPDTAIWRTLPVNRFIKEKLPAEDVEIGSKSWNPVETKVIDGIPQNQFEINAYKNEEDLKRYTIQIYAKDLRFRSRAGEGLICSIQTPEWILKFNDIYFRELLRREYQGYIDHGGGNASYFTQKIDAAGALRILDEAESAEIVFGQAMKSSFKLPVVFWNDDDAISATERVFEEPFEEDCEYNRETFSAYPNDILQASEHDADQDRRLSTGYRVFEAEYRIYEKGKPISDGEKNWTVTGSIFYSGKPVDLIWKNKVLASITTPGEKSFEMGLCFEPEIYDWHVTYLRFTDLDSEDSK